jgi:hypothetical protein
LYNKNFAQQFCCKPWGEEFMSAPLKNITGRPISSESDFYGREKEVSSMWRKLENDHVLLLAPAEWVKPR